MTSAGTTTPGTRQLADLLVWRWLLPAALLLLLAACWWSAESAAGSRDERERRLLALQAEALAEAVPAALAADLGDPRRRPALEPALAAQLAGIAPALGLAAVRTAIPAADGVLAGPGWGGSGPLPPWLRSAAERGGSGQGEEGDRSWAWAPVRHPHHGRLLLAVGVERARGSWRADRWRIRLPFLLCGGAALALVGAVAALAGGARSAGRRGRHRDALATLVVGGGATALLALAVHDGELRHRTEDFDRIAALYGRLVSERVERAALDETRHLAAFLENAAAVTAEGFARHAAVALANPALVGLGWAPRSGEPAGPRFRLALAAPADKTQGLIGLDPEADPARRAAVASCLATGLPCASGPLRLLTADAIGIECLAPVPGPAGEVRGIAGLALRPDILLRGGIDGASLGIPALLRGRGDAPPFLLAGTAGAPAGLAAQRWPLLALGHGDLVEIAPGAGFLARHPLQGGWLAASWGALATLLAASMVEILALRRRTLEHRVRDQRAFRNALLDRLPVGVLMIDAESRSLEMFNRHAAAILGGPPDRVAGRRCLPPLDGDEDGDATPDGGGAAKASSGRC